jgi:hypothetical protein
MFASPVIAHESNTNRSSKAAVSGEALTTAR